MAGRKNFEQESRPFAQPRLTRCGAHDCRGGAVGKAAAICSRIADVAERYAEMCKRGFRVTSAEFFTSFGVSEIAPRLGEKEGGLFGAFLQSVAIVQGQMQHDQGNMDDLPSDYGESDIDARSAESTSQRRGSDAGSAAEGFDPLLHPRPPPARTPEKMLEEALVDYEARAAGAQRLVQLRCNEREAYEHAVEVYARLRNKWESQTSSIWDSSSASERPPSFPAADGHRLYAEICAAADALAAAQRQYQIVDRSTNDELRRLRKEMHRELCEALRAVAMDAAEQNRRYAQAWDNLAARVDVFRAADVGGDGPALFGTGVQSGTFAEGVATVGG